MSRAARTVGELRALLVGQPDDLRLVVPDDDHSYRLVSVRVTEIAEGARRHLYEYHGEQHLQNPTDRVIPALVVE